MERFFSDTATTEIYTLSLHDALPIFRRDAELHAALDVLGFVVVEALALKKDLTRKGDLGVLVAQHRNLYLPRVHADRKSTRLNSSHANISYAVFCLKKKNDFYKCVFL